MPNTIDLKVLEGNYDITYQSSPPLDDWYEPGHGSAQIAGNELTGSDALGIVWRAKLTPLDDKNLEFDATLDPTTAAPNAGLMDKNGNMTRSPQHYKGTIKVTLLGSDTLLRTQVIQGPLTIDVQFRRIK